MTYTVFFSKVLRIGNSTIGTTSTTDYQWSVKMAFCLGRFCVIIKSDLLKYALLVAIQNTKQLWLFHSAKWSNHRTQGIELYHANNIQHDVEVQMRFKFRRISICVQVYIEAIYWLQNLIKYLPTLFRFSNSNFKIKKRHSTKTKN